MAASPLDLTRDVFTLADLDAWPETGTWLAVLGQPIRHSVSPTMHGAALAEMAQRDARFQTWRYVRFEVPAADLPRALGLFHARKFRGLNLTVPHKVLAYAQVRHVDARAQPAGAVNTLRWREDGWEGFNTDGDGLVEGLRHDLHAELRGAAVVLLGTGGAARAAAVACLQAGCASLSIGNRTKENLDTLLARLEPLAGATRLRGFDLAAPPHDLPRGALIINATSVGLKLDDLAPINLEHLPEPAGVYDMIYNPPSTPLLRQAKTLGLPAANGLSMLVRQGARALEIWTHAEAPVSVMTQAARVALHI